MFFFNPIFKYFTVYKNFYLQHVFFFFKTNEEMVAKALFMNVTKNNKKNVAKKEF